MAGRNTRSAAAALLVGASLVISASASAATPSVRTLAAKEAHLAGMAYRMATANADLCSQPEMMTGLIVHDLTQYHPTRRADVARAFSLGGGFGVLQLVRGAAASTAGLRVDDEIIAVGSVSVDNASGRAAAPSFRRVQGFADILSAQLAKGPVDLRVRRNGQLMNITLTARRGCGGDLSLSNSGTVNAWADGHHIVITTAMTDFAGSDDEIAFVIAHEMAHNILGHNRPRGKTGFFGSLQSRKIELDADRFAVRLMAGAGYRPAAGISFLERSRQRYWWAFSLGHPGFGARIRIVGDAISKWHVDAVGHSEASAQLAPPARFKFAAVDQTSPTPFKRPVSIAEAASVSPLR